MVNERGPSKTIILGRARGKPKDSSEKVFMKVKKNFADVVNGYFFKGKKIVDPDKLVAVDTVSTIAYERTDGGTEHFERIRDVLEKAVIYSDGCTRYMLLGIENQSTIDPWMVFRCFFYDACTYMDQVEELQRSKRLGTKEPAPNDNTVQMPYPVMTLVVYFGPDEWTAPKSLCEAVGLTGDITHPFARLFHDYEIDVLEPYRMNDSDFNVYESSFRELMMVMKYLGDHEMLKALFARDERFKNMDRKAVDVMRACTGAKITYNETQRTVDMRNAFLEEREAGFAEGMEKGRAEGKAEGKAEGRIEGKNQEKLAIALRMLTEKLLDVPTIAKVTGLTPQQVQALQTAQ